MIVYTCLSLRRTNGPFTIFIPLASLVYLLAVLPALPLIGVACHGGLYIAEESDEFERSIIVQIDALGSSAELFPISTIWGFLRRLRHNAPHRLHVLRLSLLLDLHGNLPQPIIRREVPMKNRLRILRAERNWSQADLAERLEVSRQSVNAIETRAKFDPSLPLAFKLAVSSRI